MHIHVVYYFIIYSMYQYIMLSARVLLSFQIQFYCKIKSLKMRMYIKRSLSPLAQHDFLIAAYISVISN